MNLSVAWQSVALTLVVVFTFAYIFFGGASVHVWSNSVQASTMIVVGIFDQAASSSGGRCGKSGW